ncbi:hypothetical protein GMRT_10491 [Giardia muris]|uniref:Coiled-coil protein n=1 Tax=Giardia muris TaxID=5742 RepID=A0A4Z1SS85_GIAMU|nr:hypothetical protein GMRT_10491 [Giardia muris]|eukprot:TNJ26518.1 hypothetical protein GMRT_10491 [Giardia muris]
MELNIERIINDAMARRAPQAAEDAGTSFPRPVSGANASRIKDRIAGYKDQIESLREQARDLNAKLLDERAEHRVFREEQEALIRELHAHYASQMEELVARNKQLIERLMGDKKSLADQCEAFAAELRDAKANQASSVALEAENNTLKEKVEGLSKELSTLKMDFDGALTKEKQKIISSEAKKRKKAVDEAKREVEETFAARLEPQLQGMVSAHKAELSKLQGDHELEIAKVRQELVGKYEEMLQVQRRELIQQHTRDVDDLQSDFQAKIRGLRNTLEEEHRLEIDGLKKKLMLEQESTHSVEISRLRNILSEKNLEIESLNSRLGKATAGTAAAVEGLKNEYIALLEKAKSSYAVELSNIRLQHRELALSIWSQNRPELVDKLRAERDDLLRDLARKCDDKTEMARRAEKEAASHKIRELERQIDALHQNTAQIGELNAQLSAKEYQIRMANQRVEELLRIRARGEEQAARNSDRWHLELEDAYATIARLKEGTARFETQLYTTVQSRVETIIAKKDELIEQLQRELLASREECAHLTSQLHELDSAMDC